MYTIQLHRRIDDLTVCFQFVGFWHRGDQPSTRETQLKLFYSIHFLLFSIALIAGACTTNNSDESIYLTAASTIALVVVVRLFYMIWKQQEIVELLHLIGVHSIDDQEQFILANERLNRFMKFAVAVVCITFLVTICTALGTSLLLCEKKLLFNIAFPFDWRKSDVVYWIEFLFIFTALIEACFSLFFVALTWYLLLNCAIKYEVLSQRLRDMGEIKSERSDGSISETRKENLFVRDLISGIRTHQNINEYFR